MPVGHSHQLRQIPPLSVSVCDLFGDGNREPDFEGFLIPREGFDSTLTNQRIFVLQAAVCLCLEEPTRLPVLPLSPGPRGSPPDE